MGGRKALKKGGSIKSKLEYVELAVDMVFILITGSTPTQLLAKLKTIVSAKR